VKIECRRTNEMGLLTIWAADDISNNVLVKGDDAVVPKCCDPTVPDGTPVIMHLISINCSPECVS